MSRDPIEIALVVTRILEQLGVPYAIVGSIASSAYGELRATMAVDMVAEFAAAQIEPFARALGDERRRRGACDPPREDGVAGRLPPWGRPATAVVSGPPDRLLRPPSGGWAKRASA